jgi:Na+-driven multidrug efflux pump
MQILFVGSAFVALSLLLDTFFINQLHRPGLVSIVVWLKFALGLTLSLILIPQFGMRGAAIALTITQIVGALIYTVLYLRATDTHLRELLHLDKKDLALLKSQVFSVMGRSKTPAATADTT